MMSTPARGLAQAGVARCGDTHAISSWRVSSVNSVNARPEKRRTREPVSRGSGVSTLAGKVAKSQGRGNQGRPAFARVGEGAIAKPKVMSVDMNHEQCFRPSETLLKE